MKKTILIALIGLLLSAFSTAPGKELAGYKLKNGQDITFHDYNLWAITNEISFDKTFVAENEKTLRPHFESELVVAAKVMTEKNSYKVIFKKILLQNDHLDVFFSVERKKIYEPADSSVSLLSWPKAKGVKKVNFYHGDMMVKSVPLVEVY